MKKFAVLVLVLATAGVAVALTNASAVPPLAERVKSLAERIRGNAESNPVPIAIAV